jgi:hypothetical protein
MSLTSIRVFESRQGAFVAGLASMFRGLLQNTLLAVLAIMAMVSAASAETLLMPNRDARTTAPVVVWGVTTLANGTSFTLDYGDLTAPTTGTVSDRSYIAFTHTYVNQGTYTVTLTVGAETTTTTLQVFNPALMIGGVNGDNNRSLGINMAIQDGLRFLWVNQLSRAASFPATVVTSWNNTGYPYADTSLVALAFENQGYKITANVAPTGIYEKYIVRRALNYVLSQLAPVTLTPANAPAGNSCAIYADCIGLQPSGDQGYTTAMAILGFAGSGALAQINTEVAGYASGKTYGEILQRLVNAMAWGQNDSGTGTGGWYYTFNSTVLDGSTMGWTTLALLDAAAAGATIPAFVKTQYEIGFKCALNTNGSFDYNGDCNPAGDFSGIGSPAKGGTGLLGMFYLGNPVAPATVATIASYINGWWSGSGGIGGNYANCSGGGGNKGCAYAMFNNFKGLKLQGITTLPSVGRAAGPGAQPANDWYADYQDWLVANQTAPATTAGGNWNGLAFSCCATGTSISAAMAELILSPVALVAPDPTLFSTVGLSPLSAVNPVGTNHTVTAFAQASNGNPVPGATVVFRVLTGPNTGATGTSTTGSDGKTSFTYTDTGGAGTDTIQAFIGNLGSNVVTKIWRNPVATCDLNNDGVVSPADLKLFTPRLNTNATGPGDPYDPNGDGRVNVADVRYCQLRQTASAP